MEHMGFSVCPITTWTQTWMCAISCDIYAMDVNDDALCSCCCALCIDISIIHRFQIHTEIQSKQFLACAHVAYGHRGKWACRWNILQDMHAMHMDEYAYWSWCSALSIHACISTWMYLHAEISSSRLPACVLLSHGHKLSGAKQIKTFKFSLICGVKSHYKTPLLRAHC